MIDLTVSEARQWTFCPRVLWHRRAVPHRIPETPKMALGKAAETALQKLETRRTARRYGLERARRQFSVALWSERLHVRGICDLVLEVDGTEIEASAVYPVDVKRTLGGTSEHHAVQLAGYALLLEEERQLRPGTVTTGFVVLIPSGTISEVPLDAHLRGQFEQALESIRQMLDTERFPPPTPHRGFCPQCEYVHFCGDVL